MDEVIVVSEQSYGVNMGNVVAGDGNMDDMVLIEEIDAEGVDLPGNGSMGDGVLSDGNMDRDIDDTVVIEEIDADGVELAQIGNMADGVSCDGNMHRDIDDIVVIEEIDADGDLLLRVLNNVEEGGDGRVPEVGKNKGPVPNLTLYESMEFRSGVEFVAHVHRFGQSAGFGVFIKESVKDNRKKVAAEVAAAGKKTKIAEWFDLENKYKHHIKIRMKCRKGGKFKSRSSDPNRTTTTCKTDCPYVVNACRSPINGTVWKITKLHNIHNHDLDPDLSQYLPRYRRICIEDQMIAKELHKGGVGVANMFDIFVNRYEFYELVPFTESDLRNYIYFVNRKPLKDTDFARMEIHFRKMREQSPNFFYEFDVGDDFTLKNVFWADSRCREAFIEFGDVVSFDTTFVSNRYKMPFAPFIGVNHHGKTMLFGCALIAKEDTASFTWLFKTFIKCMGKEPGCILTDQDKAIGKAVATVFPGISHRWCIWHVMQNCRRHLGMREGWGEMSKKLQDVLHDSFSVEEFEAGWQAWAADYGVGGNTWVKDMYKDRMRWAPVFFKGSFWAGMSSTQRSEGMNHYLKGFVDINTCLSKFVEEYGKAVSKRIREEDKDTAVGSDRCSRQTSNHRFEAIYEKLYTRNKFVEIHDELNELVKTRGTIVRVYDDNVVEYDVLVKEFRVGWTKRTNFRVIMDRATLEVKCDCRNFEFTGIMCVHMFRVFWEEDTEDVPERYVFPRWRKDIPRKYLSDAYPMAALRGSVGPEVKRYQEVNKISQEICVLVMNNEELHKEALRRLTSLKDELKERTLNPEGIYSHVIGGVGRVYRSLEKAMEGSNVDGGAEDVGPSCVKDPIDKRGRGRGVTKRKVAFVDQIGGRKGRGRGKKDNGSSGGGKSTTTTTPGKDGTSVFPGGGWNVPIASNYLRHGFQVTGGTGSISLPRRFNGWN